MAGGLVWIMSGLLLRSFDETRGAQACADNDVAPRAYGEEFSYVTDKKTSKFLHPGVGCSVPLFSAKICSSVNLIHFICPSFQ